MTDRSVEGDSYRESWGDRSVKGDSYRESWGD